MMERLSYHSAGRPKGYDADTHLGVPFCIGSDVSMGPREPTDDTMRLLALSYSFDSIPTRSVNLCGQGYGTNANQLHAVVFVVSDLINNRQYPSRDGCWKSASRPAWLEAAESTVDDLSFSVMEEIVVSLNYLLLTAGFDEISQNLQIADPKRMSTDAVTAIARTTYCARDKIQNWKGFVKAAAREMSSRGEPDDLMMGLI